MRSAVQTVKVLDVQSYKAMNSDVTHQRIVDDIMMAPMIDRN